MSSPTDHPETQCVPGEPGKCCELEQNLEILRRVEAFSDIPMDRLKVYAYLSRRLCYRPGEFLFRQGQQDNRGYVVISGRAQVIREFKDHSVLLNEFKEGDFFGGLSLLSDVTRLFSVRAATYVECLSLDRESFRKLLVQFPEVAVRVLDMMVRRIVQMEEKLLQSQARECIFV